MRGFVERADYERACEERDAALEELAWFRSEASDADEITAATTLARRLGIKRSAVKTLLALYAARGRALTLAHLDEAVPAEGNRADGDRNYSICFKVWVHQIRKALGADTIETIYGVGYRLTPKGMGAVASLLKGVGLA